VQVAEPSTSGWSGVYVCPMCTSTWASPICGNRAASFRRVACSCAWTAHVFWRCTARYDHGRILVQTALMNSPLHDTLVNHNLRFIDWPHGYGDPSAYWHSVGAKHAAGPMILTPKHLRAVFQSSAMFARKARSSTTTIGTESAPTAPDSLERITSSSACGAPPWFPPLCVSSPLHRELPMCGRWCDPQRHFPNSSRGRTIFVAFAPRVAYVREMVRPSTAFS